MDPTDVMSYCILLAMKDSNYPNMHLFEMNEKLIWGWKAENCYENHVQLCPRTHFAIKGINLTFYRYAI